jgi:hypothetical protein
MAGEDGEAANFGFKFLIFCKIRFVDRHCLAEIGRLCLWPSFSNRANNRGETLLALSRVGGGDRDHTLNILAGIACRA